MSYVVSGLPLEDFQPLFGLDEAALAARGVIRQVVKAKPGSPCRITLVDAKPGETVLLLNHEHQSAATPYRSAHAIFVREAATQTARLVDQLPEVLTSRLISVRAFDTEGMMVDGHVLPGAELESLVLRWLERPQVAYLHAHNAGRGCFAAKIERG